MGCPTRSAPPRSIALGISVLDLVLTSAHLTALGGTEAGPKPGSVLKMRDRPESNRCSVPPGIDWLGGPRATSCTYLRAVDKLQTEAAMPARPRTALLVK